MSPRQTESLLDPLLEWYEMNGRHDLPWREPERSAFQLLIAEILLQKTRAEAVTGAYVPLMARYPTPEAFVSAPIDEIEGGFRRSGSRNARRIFGGAPGNYLPATAAPCRGPVRSCWTFTASGSTPRVRY